MGENKKTVPAEVQTMLVVTQESSTAFVLAFGTCSSPCIGKLERVQVPLGQYL